MFEVSFTFFCCVLTRLTFLFIKLNTFWRAWRSLSLRMKYVATASSTRRTSSGRGRRGGVRRRMVLVRRSRGGAPGGPCGRAAWWRSRGVRRWGRTWWGARVVVGCWICASRSSPVWRVFFFHKQIHFLKTQLNISQQTRLSIIWKICIFIE